MKITIASSGKDKESEISSQAAHALFFLVFNGEGELIETFENPYDIEMRGTGPAIVDLLAEKGTDVFIAENIGERMARALETKNIRYQKVSSGTVAEALQVGLRLKI